MSFTNAKEIETACRNVLYAISENNLAAAKSTFEKLLANTTLDCMEWKVEFRNKNRTVFAMLRWVQNELNRAQQYEEKLSNKAELVRKFCIESFNNILDGKLEQAEKCLTDAKRICGDVKVLSKTVLFFEGDDAREFLVSDLLVMIQGILNEILSPRREQETLEKAEVVRKICKESYDCILSGDLQQAENYFLDAYKICSDVNVLSQKVIFFEEVENGREFLVSDLLALIQRELLSTAQSENGLEGILETSKQLFMQIAEDQLIGKTNKAKEHCLNTIDMLREGNFLQAKIQLNAAIEISNTVSVLTNDVSVSFGLNANEETMTVQCMLMRTGEILEGKLIQEIIRLCKSVSLELMQKNLERAKKYFLTIKNIYLYEQHIDLSKNIMFSGSLDSQNKSMTIAAMLAETENKIKQMEDKIKKPQKLLEACKEIREKIALSVALGDLEDKKITLDEADELFKTTQLRVLDVQDERVKFARTADDKEESMSVKEMIMIVAIELSKAKRGQLTAQSEKSLQLSSLTQSSVQKTNLFGSPKKSLSAGLSKVSGLIGSWFGGKEIEISSPILVNRSSVTKKDISNGEIDIDDFEVLDTDNKNVAIKGKVESSSTATAVAKKLASSTNVLPSTSVNSQNRENVVVKHSTISSSTIMPVAEITTSNTNAHQSTAQELNNSVIEPSNKNSFSDESSEKSQNIEDVAVVPKTMSASSVSSSVEKNVPNTNAYQFEIQALDEPAVDLDRNHPLIKEFQIKCVELRGRTNALLSRVVDKTQLSSQEMSGLRDNRGFNISNLMSDVDTVLCKQFSDLRLEKFLVSPKSNFLVEDFVTTVKRYKTATVLILQQLNNAVQAANETYEQACANNPSEISKTFGLYQAEKNMLQMQIDAFVKTCEKIQLLENKAYVSNSGILIYQDWQLPRNLGFKLEILEIPMEYTHDVKKVNDQQKTEELIAPIKINNPNVSGANKSKGIGNLGASVAALAQIKKRNMNSQNESKIDSAANNKSALVEKTAFELVLEQLEQLMRVSKDNVLTLDFAQLNSVVKNLCAEFKKLDSIAKNYIEQENGFIEITDLYNDFVFFALLKAGEKLPSSKEGEYKNNIQMFAETYKMIQALVDAEQLTMGGFKIPENKGYECHPILIDGFEHAGISLEYAKNQSSVLDIASITAMWNKEDELTEDEVELLGKDVTRICEYMLQEREGASLQALKDLAKYYYVEAFLQLLNMDSNDNTFKTKVDSFIKNYRQVYKVEFELGQGSPEPLVFTVATSESQKIPVYLKNKLEIYDISIQQEQSSVLQYRF